MPSQCVAFVLAAGRSTRMKSSIPKIFLSVGGRAMIDYMIDVAVAWAGDETYVVLSPAVTENSSASSLLSRTIPVEQSSAKGTGHAFSLALHAAAERDPDLRNKYILVLLGDTPLVEAHDVKNLIEAVSFRQSAMGVIFMKPPHAGAYGRCIIEHNQLRAIVEARDADKETLLVDTCNTGVMMIHGGFALDNVHRLQPSVVTGEYYLTDFVTIAPQCEAIEGDWQRFMGVNTPEEWANTESILQHRFRHRAQEQGAFLADARTVFFSYDTVLSPEVYVEPFVRFGPGVRVEQKAIIRSFSVLEGCHLECHAQVGPFAHIRPNSTIKSHAIIGNFVEIKNSTIGGHSKVKHLSYVGDVTMGKHVNVGAGCVFANYDGIYKHRSTVENEVRIGANTTIVSPITIGTTSTIAAGSTITQSVPAFTLALARTYQTHKTLSPESPHYHRAHTEDVPQNTLKF